ncbi:MAG: hypothetical protein AAFX04_05515 [Pseudomonadota bacterium]
MPNTASAVRSVPGSSYRELEKAISQQWNQGRFTEGPSWGSKPS